MILYLVQKSGQSNFKIHFIQINNRGQNQGAMDISEKNRVEDVVNSDDSEDEEEPTADVIIHMNTVGPGIYPYTKMIPPDVVITYASDYDNNSKRNSNSNSNSNSNINSNINRNSNGNSNRNINSNSNVKKQHQQQQKQQQKQTQQQQQQHQQ